MNLNIDTSVYNERRYGLPYIAEIKFDAGGNQETRWGKFVGAAGDSGILVLNDVEVGAIIMRGQKDNRKPCNSAPNYYVLKEDGALESVSKGDAFKLSINS